ncbi:SSU ribosomal protein S20P [Geoalkalibacter ferrihydriticus]|uniref:Small ribosomal subunit protein bS20 n=2 Tax=Geoalkalibacter ferrihydriticus TaxID=392333 RepID=A0A0C2HR78_9BACT|nr:30S ribosomal protein S20 [Geoalkalibacter ferrihydriticus]KIH77375.1 30S ribosomal protein S20 [Geoalkalibacter ferrihydriticus DSM 17813]SDM17656.1 SSU ribosomal protein S20P [Geoalkalibacter ferrihydriticus]
MANHKSALKRIKQNEKRAARNRHIRSTMRTLVKQVREAAAGGDAGSARAALERAVPYIDKSASKGIIHKATASRKIARLTKLVGSLA